MSFVAIDQPILTLDNGIEIRVLRDGDEDFISKHGTDSKVWAQLSDLLPHPYTIQAAQDWISTCRDSKNFAPSGDDLEDPEAVRRPTQYAIVIDGEACGSIGLTFHSGHRRLTATIGYWLGSAHWQKGVMSAVVPAFIQWTWSTFGYLVRLHGTAYEFNIGSQKCMKKAGFVQEGVCINATIKLGVIHNEVWLAAIRPGVEAFRVKTAAESAVAAP